MNAPISLNDQLIENIDLNQLVIHPGNVRKSTISKEEALAPLAASIASVGLINPLIVTSMKGSNYGVIAGGCRLAALKLLAKKNKLPEDLAKGIPCKALNNSPNAEEISLVENVMRQDMTAADQIEAWGKLAANGTSIDIIAARFGVAETLVRQRLALAGVCPQILALLREEKIGLDCVKAFTLTQDHDLQRQILAELGNHAPAWRVRQMIISDKVQVKDKRVQLVGLETYIKAGGNVIHDLFDPDEGLINDEELLDNLVAERFEAERARVLSQSWSWVSNSDGTEYERRFETFTQTSPTRPEATPEERSRIEEIEQLLSDADEEGEKEGVDYDALHDEHDKIMDGIEARAFWADDVKAKGGVFLGLGYDGQIKCSAGWVAHEKKLATETEEQEKPPKSVHSGTLREVLERTRTQIVRDALTRTDTLCNDIIVFNLARTLVSSSDNIGVIGYGIIQPDRREDNPEDPCYGELLGFRGWLDDSWRGR